MTDHQAPRPGMAGAQPAALVCFSHLRWGFVWQRPQHLLTRLARQLPVYVVEEPEFVPGAGADDLRLIQDRGVTVLTPLFAEEPEPAWGFNERNNRRVRALLAPIFADLGLLGGAAETGRDLIAWYYTPMALGAGPAAMRPALTVYDAMDELASFAGAPRSLREREAALMAAADLVFTGGPSLYAARKDRHPRVSCYPSGVEAAHFAQAAGSPPPPDLASRPRPIIGFYGVLDERLDLDLIDGIAAARPEWTVAMIGPVAKIAEADLPRRPNLHYLGQRPYRDLPTYLAAFDVAILPFARNEATRFISPTKTLEYLAGGKPTVSTSIRDVVDLYGPVVRLADSPTAFVDAVERAMAESPAERSAREAMAHRILAEHDWDAIAADMWRQIEATLRRAAIDDRVLTDASAVRLEESAAPLAALADFQLPREAAAVR